jgi:hypothetical protein
MIIMKMISSKTTMAVISKLKTSMPTRSGAGQAVIEGLADLPSLRWSVLRRWQ